MLWDRVSALNEVHSQIKLTLAWIPSHKGGKRNEVTDDLTRQWPSRPFFGYITAPMNDGKDHQDKGRKRIAEGTVLSY